MESASEKSILHLHYLVVRGLDYAESKYKGKKLCICYVIMSRPDGAIRFYIFNVYKSGITMQANSFYASIYLARLCLLKMPILDMETVRSIKSQHAQRKTISERMSQCLDKQ